ncbi:MAG: serine/threonine-protein kinase [Candidatus Melainabacteria bacterium]|nr:serine/threonine-protein kinase [Candidatus Melainabacteria bacterium]
MEKETAKFTIEKERIELRYGVKVCPTCAQEYDDDEHTVCPVDQTLLCPVGEDALIGKHISNFEVLSKIGAGSSANVYLAKKIAEQTAEMVAIKVLDANLLSDPIAVKRFQLEAQLVRSLNHPQIASVLDFGICADGRPFLILEYIDGVTLKELLDKQTKLTPADAISIFGDVMDAVESAHNAGVLHRDLKPSNIIIDSTGRAKVLDFGVAKVIGIEDTTTVTLTGVSVGTPAYMSPEQCLGLEQDVRSDIYSIGCLMYECLSGRKVFPSDNAFSCMRQHSFFEPVPIANIDSSLPMPLSKAVMKCLEKSAEERFQSISDLRNALLSDISSTAEVSSKPGGGGGAKRPFNKIAFALYLMMLMSIISLALTVGSLKRHEIDQSNIADIPNQPRPPGTPLVSVFQQPHRSLDPKLSAQEQAELGEAIKNARYDGVWTEGFTHTSAPTNLTLGTLSASGQEGSGIKTDLPIFAGVRDASGANWYVLARDGLIHLDPKTNKATSLPIPNTLPIAQVFTGITRDTKRNRILVVSEQYADSSNLVENSTLYAYQLDTKKWSGLGQIPKLALSGLAYSPSDDTVYALAFRQQDDGTARNGAICQLASGGEAKNLVSVSLDLQDLLALSPPSVQLSVHNNLLFATFEGQSTWIFNRNTGKFLRKIR